MPIVIRVCYKAPLTLGHGNFVAHTKIISMNASPNDPPMDAQWVLDQLPLVTFFCENDEYYTIRYAAASGGGAFGYKLTDFIDNRNRFAVSALEQSDLRVMEQATEQALLGTSPVVARLRIRDVSDRPLALLLMLHGVFDRSEKLLGLAGMAVDLRRVPALDGEYEVLTPRGHDAIWTHKTEPPAQINAEWLVDLLPLSTYFAENDPFFTERFVRGPIYRQLGYTPEQMLDGKKMIGATVIDPADEDLADDHVEETSRSGTVRTAVRLHAIHAKGHQVPMLAFTQGVRHPVTFKPGLVGAVLDLTTAPQLQGKSRMWRMLEP